jgi:hypothetical protein
MPKSNKAEELSSLSLSKNIGVNKGDSGFILALAPWALQLVKLVVTPKEPEQVQQLLSFI